MSDLTQYATRLESMTSSEFTKEIEVLPLDLMLKLALMRRPITVYRGNSMWDRDMTIQQEQVNYLELAKLLTSLKEDNF